MNYYEELGIKPDADAEEIRKAHRRLVKLMHPDHQRDESLKLLAETQMRRLNSIVAVLLDKEEREEYDEELCGRDRIKPAPTTWHSIPWWIASTLGAVVLTVGGVWFYADHVGSGLGGGGNPVYIPPQETSSRPDAPVRSSPGAEDSASLVGSADAPATPAAPTVDGDVRANAPSVSAASIPASSKPMAPVPDNKRALAEEARAAERKAAADADKAARESKLREDTERARAAELAKARQLTPLKGRQLAQTKADGVPKTSDSQKSAPPKKVFNLPSNVQIASARRPVNQNQSPFTPPPGLYPALVPREDRLTAVSSLPVARAPKPEPVDAPSVTGAPVHQDPLEGDWVYAPKEPEKRRTGFYPPQFISLKIVKQADGFHGQYSARYDVADNRPISPDVNFQVKSVDKTARKFVWQSRDGSRGTLAIHPLDGETIRLEWRTTVFSGGPALSSGIATLVRRGD